VCSLRRSRLDGRLNLEHIRRGTDLLARWSTAVQSAWRQALILRLVCTTLRICGMMWRFYRSSPGKDNFDETTDLMGSMSSAATIHHDNDVTLDGGAYPQRSGRGRLLWVISCHRGAARSSETGRRSLYRGGAAKSYISGRRSLYRSGTTRSGDSRRRRLCRRGAEIPVASAFCNHERQKRASSGVQTAVNVDTWRRPLFCAAEVERLMDSLQGPKIVCFRHRVCSRNWQVCCRNFLSVQYEFSIEAAQMMWNWRRNVARCARLAMQVRQKLYKPRFPEWEPQLLYIWRHRGGAATDIYISVVNANVSQLCEQSLSGCILGC